MDGCSSLVIVVRYVGSVLCDELISRSEESYHVYVCVCVCIIWKLQQWGGIGLNWAVAPLKKKGTTVLWTIRHRGILHDVCPLNIPLFMPQKIRQWIIGSRHVTFGSDICYKHSIKHYDLTSKIWWLWDSCRLCQADVIYRHAYCVLCNKFLMTVK